VRDRNVWDFPLVNVASALKLSGQTITEGRVAVGAVVDQSPRTARAGAMEESELVSIDRDTLMGIVKKQPAIAMAMLRGISDRLRHMNSLLS